MLGTNELMQNAWKAGTVIPAFNIPYLPMMEAIVRALRDTRCFGLIAVARPDWTKFAAGSTRDVAAEYERVKDETCTRLHLDHVPVVDEDNYTVEYDAIIAQALNLGYQSAMVDGSRLRLKENIAATKMVVNMAHAAGVPVEAELGAVLGHEAGPLPPYEELFASGKGFTDPEEAKRFVEETNVDWLSVAIGNIHGAIQGAAKDKKKVQARLNIEHLAKLSAVTHIPLVLHGGSGITPEHVRAAAMHGITKLNVGTEIRQAYEKAMPDIPKAQEAVRESIRRLVRDHYRIEGSAKKIVL